MKVINFLITSNAIGYVAISFSFLPLFILIFNFQKIRFLSKPFLLVLISIFITNAANLTLTLFGVRDQNFYYVVFNVIEIIVYHAMFFYLLRDSVKLFIHLILFSIIISALIILLNNISNFEQLSSIYLKFFQISACLVYFKTVIITSKNFSIFEDKYFEFCLGLIVYSSINFHVFLFKDFILKLPINLFTFVWFIPQLTGILYFLLLTKNVWKIIR